MNWGSRFSGLVAVIVLLLAQGCGTPPIEDDDAITGERRISIETASGTFEVWTRKVGDSPRIKVLLLHGGPGMTHEYLLNFADHLPAAGIEIYFYDQLGSHLSDQPDNPDLWTIERFVDEVEQVRLALGLDADNFYLWGNSWGGILGIEYALAYPDRLKGLIVSNMMSSIPAYNRYAHDVLMTDMDPVVLAELQTLDDAGAYDDPRYMELLMEHHYSHHVLRRPVDEWPANVLASLEHVNPNVYVLMQGPSELGARGRLEFWDRSADLGRITAPTLVIGATHDTMDPAHMEWMAGEFTNGRFLLCPDGSHMAHIDDEEVYFEGLIKFLKDVDAGRF